MKLITNSSKGLILESRENSRLNELQRMSDILSEFFNEFIFTTKENVERIISNVSDITSNCNVISYNEELNAETYALWHFLDRYHRFQIIFDELLRQGIINFSKTERKYPYDILDIGTGPGMSMFVLNDFFNGLISFGKLNGVNKLGNLDFKIDYLERSTAFRNWLHHFTEWHNFGDGRNNNSKVPYHHGNFSDFLEVDFNQSFVSSHIDYDGDYSRKHFFRKFRFDYVISSNFFTDISFFKSSINSFRKVVDNLRNGGLLIVVGAKGGQYIEINNAIKHFGETYEDTSGRFDASLEQITLESDIMSYSPKGETGNIINSFRSRFFDVVERHGLTGKLDKNLTVHKANCLKGGSKKDVKWKVMVFKKHSNYLGKKGKIKL